jgi:predicted nucleotidyltransferase
LGRARARGKRKKSESANKLKEELKEMFGREVDLVSRRGIEASRNYLRRKAILGSAKVLYAA